MGKSSLIKINKSKFKCVFLDRDGVINDVILKNGNPHPPINVQGVRILKNVNKSLISLKKSGFYLAVITNQPDVSRKITTKKQVEAINNYIMSKLPLDEINTCFHDNFHNCQCRKPQPGMILDVAKRKNIDLTKSFMIGDRKSDIEAGKKAGCKTIFIDNNYNEEKPKNYDFKAVSLYAASQIILKGINHDRNT